ncbi:MAG: hypothetical protein IJI07_01330 [Flexilinea sp.]|nr:hypothetical protein [Flexilinea sp.]
MEKSSFVLEGRNCTVYSCEQPEVLLIRPVGRHEAEVQDQLTKALCAETRVPFLLAEFEVEDWNRDLSPWKEPPVFGPEGFGEGAAHTLHFIQENLIPGIRERYDLPKGIPVIIGGYSLAGLFSLWSAYQTDAFMAAAAASPSVWFIGWIDYAQAHRFRGKYTYLSLGDKEGRTRNPVMAKVNDCIQTQLELLTDNGISCTLEWNKGDHFKESGIRSAKAFAWCIHSIIRDAAAKAVGTAGDLSTTL